MNTWEGNVDYGMWHVMRYGDTYLPAEFVAPAADVEGEEDGDKVLREGDHLVEADHLHQSEVSIAEVT